VQGLLNGITIPQLKAAGMSLKEVREFKEGFKYLLSLRLDLSVVRHTVDVVNLLVENEV
jgi:hypothetical protein